MNKPIELFRYCPRCGQPLLGHAHANLVECDACGLHYFLNAVVAAGAIITDDCGRVLFLRRAKDPGKGQLGLPGGFVNVGETAEEAVRREVREEINLELETLTYLCSHPNPYAYLDIVYPVLDLYFTARPRALDTLTVLEEAEAFYWLAPGEIRLDDIAFPAVRSAIAAWLAQQKR